MSSSTKSSKSPPPLPDDHESPPGPMGSASGVNDEDERIGEIGDDTDQSKGSDLNPSAEEPKLARDKGKGKVVNGLIDDKDDKNTDDGGEEEPEADEDEDDDEEEDGESDDQEERGEEEEEDGDEEQKGDDEEQPWQAVWSAEHNAWYFWNSQNGQVTWTNPLLPPTSNPPLPNEPPPLPNEPLPSNPPLSSLAYPSQTETSTEYNPAGQSGIDPALAYLLPPEQRGAGLSQNDAAAQKGLFNARTGRFTKADYQYNVDHLDEYNRAKRMSSHYFDVEAWERQKSEEHEKRKRDEEMGTSSKRKITKKDMDRFRKKKAEQRARSQAWLRD
ncbi:hypothetical protein M231_07682 [Tremella mesenterica]|uniref:WW domain-containing protein n=1 Tax=Tremella mesenterica TaxID=5217 RepID=A0A4Q1B8T1_TREME|nr:hypothetical protein M231_07682 [Tremella mesenterica]